MATSASCRAQILRLPLEVVTELIRQLYRNEIIELADIGSLARLENVASTNSSLSVFKIGLLPSDLAERLMMRVSQLELQCLNWPFACRVEATIQFNCRVSIHHMDLVRFPLLRDIRRLQISVDYLDFEYPLGVLSNLPSIEEVTILLKCINWRERMPVTTWVWFPEVLAMQASMGHASLEELMHSEWKYNLILQVTFWEGFGSGDACVSHTTHHKFGLVCKVCISKGKIIELDTAEDAREQWKESLVDELDLELDQEEGKDDKNQKQCGA